MIILTAIIGALFRRWWGGWLSPNSTVKRIVGFIISILTAYLTLGMSWVVLPITAILMFCWMMPKHGYGMSMGRYGDHTLVKCILAMSAQYGSSTLISGLIWEYFTPHTGGLIYCLFGFIIPIGYYMSNQLWDKYNPQKNKFIDGACAYGELILGASLLGGIPLSNAITVFC